MKRQVVFTDKEWSQFQQDIARQLYCASRRSYGFTVHSRETGIEITERLEDWFLGTVSLAFIAAEAAKGES